MEPKAKPLAAATLLQRSGLTGSVLAILAVASLGTAHVAPAQTEPAQADTIGSATVNNPKAKTTQPNAPTTPGKPVVSVAPYTSSTHPGVMVRNAPTAPSAPTNATKTPAAGTNKGWIYVKPGAPKPHSHPRYGTRGDGVWYERGKTSAGGMIAHVTPRFYPYGKANVKPGHKVGLASGDAPHPAQHGAKANGKPAAKKLVSKASRGKSKMVSAKTPSVKTSTSQANFETRSYVVRHKKATLSGHLARLTVPTTFLRGALKRQCQSGH